MLLNSRYTKHNFYFPVSFFLLLLSSCYVPKHYTYTMPEKKKKVLAPYIFKTDVDINNAGLSKNDKINLKQKLLTQLDDSAKVNTNDAAFFIHKIISPPAYDSMYAGSSARNMKAALVHMGYYKAACRYKADTIMKRKIVFSLRKGTFPFYKRIEKRVAVWYMATPGIPTLIDTISYRFRNKDLQHLVAANLSESYLKKNTPVTKENILNEEGRLVTIFRNNGYYKFTADDIKIIGDTTISLLTNVSDDPFENLEALEAAKSKRNHPTIRLAVIQNPASDSSRLKKYFINNIFIYPDYNPSDTGHLIPYQDSVTRRNKYIVRYHKNLFQTRFLLRNLYLRKGDLYSQDSYTKTINSFSKTGAWQSVSIQAVENNDSLDLIVQLIPTKKYGFESNVELSYSANSNTNIATATTTGDLLGISGNASIQDRNVNKQGIKQTLSLHTGVELNLGTQNVESRINSEEIGIGYTRVIPHLFIPGTTKMINKWQTQWRKKIATQECFVSSNVGYVDRIDLFKLRNISAALGNRWVPKAHPNRTYVIKFPNIEFSYLYDQTQAFLDTLQSYPYLQYSFNTALVMGSIFSYSTYSGTQNNLFSFKFNAEGSANMGILKKYIRQFTKVDFELTKKKTYRNTSVVYHAFLGVGVPLSKNDTTLPFFKQYFSGGANSMRGWPVRGLGLGSQAIAPYGSNTFNDRTGDIKLELNYEFRYNIWQIFPNSLTLRGALFCDAGNVWNFKNPPAGTNGHDTIQLQFSNLYQQLATDIGTGFRFDFNYFIVRFDLGFRVKNPSILQNDGWQLPGITFDNLFKRGENVPDPSNPTQTINDDRYRIWRYENLNFSIGINYPF